MQEGHGPVARATLHATAHGIFEAYLNGQPVSDDVLSPGWSSYEWRLRYRSYDVTSLLRAERRFSGSRSGNGWFRGRLGWSGGSGLYGDELAALAQLEIEFADGHVQIVVTDESWTAGPSAVVVQRPLRRPDHRRPTLLGCLVAAGISPMTAWTGVHPIDFDFSRLTPYVGPPVRRQEELQPIKIWTSPAGKTLVDFGQNLVGWLRLTVRGPAAAGSPCGTPRCSSTTSWAPGRCARPKATDRFILSGGDDVFEPTFTFHGFRYAEVDGWPGELTADAIDRRGGVTPTCSGSATSSAPTSCSTSCTATWCGARAATSSTCRPTARSATSGSAGPATSQCSPPPRPTSSTSRPSCATGWPTSTLEQRAADGMVAFVVPDVLKYVKRPSQFPAPESTAIWSDAAVWVPWALWQAYGDRQVLTRQFDSMAAHVRRVESLLSPTGLWDAGFQFGDWLDPTAPPDDQPPARPTTASSRPPASTESLESWRRPRPARTQ